jgi:two-component system response regulator FlrC
MIQTHDSVLVVEDDVALREALVDTLRGAGIAVVAEGDAAGALRRLETDPVALVISDVQMPGPDGYQLLALIKRRYPELPVVLMTAYGTVAHAVAAMRDGATDYIVKPFDAQALIGMAQRRLEQRVVPNELIAVDPESRRILCLAQKIAETDATVLITGESGTGKEVYARFIRDHSARSDKPYVAINCAAIPENMLEATLFGYEKGAFTGAVAAHAGKFEQAQGGTLLLDEISEMNLGLQAKILRVLQEREVERLGGTRTIDLDVRVIATSNRDLPAEARAARFRADLYYRLNVMSLRLPPLRERRGDILPLARRAAHACARGGAAAAVLASDAEQKLLRYSWPGNARELSNIVQRAAWLATGGEITAAALDIGAAEAAAGSGAIGSADAAPFDALGIEAESDTGPGREMPGSDLLGRDLKERERELILATLRITAGSRKLAAERLGISPRTLRHKLQQLKAAGVRVPGLHDLRFATA